MTDINGVCEVCWSVGNAEDTCCEFLVIRKNWDKSFDQGICPTSNGIHKVKFDGNINDFEFVAVENGKVIAVWHDGDDKDKDNNIFDKETETFDVRIKKR